MNNLSVLLHIFNYVSTPLMHEIGHRQELCLWVYTILKTSYLHYEKRNTLKKGKFEKGNSMNCSHRHFIFSDVTGICRKRQRIQVALWSFYSQNYLLLYFTRKFTAFPLLTDGSWKCWFHFCSRIWFRPTLPKNQLLVGYSSPLRYAKPRQ